MFISFKIITSVLRLMYHPVLFYYLFISDETSNGETHNIQYIIQYTAVVYKILIDEVIIIIYRKSFAGVHNRQRVYGDGYLKL